MTEQRKKLINRFQSWLDTNPRKQIIAAVCANIAEEYAEQQLLLPNESELMAEEEKKQCDIHVVVKSFYCDDAIERLRKCKKQCKFCETLSSE